MNVTHGNASIDEKTMMKPIGKMRCTDRTFVRFERESRSNRSNEENRQLILKKQPAEQHGERTVERWIAEQMVEEAVTVQKQKPSADLTQLKKKWRKFRHSRNA